MNKIFYVYTVEENDENKFLIYYNKTVIVSDVGQYMVS